MNIPPNFKIDRVRRAARELQDALNDSGEIFEIDIDDVRLETMDGEVRRIGYTVRVRHINEVTF